MNGLRKSTRARKPVTTIDQNLDDDDDAFMTPKPKKSIERVSKKRPSTDDNDELDLITPKKRAKKKTSTKSTSKTSPYFNTKPTDKKPDSSPIKETKKTRKPRSKNIHTTIDENTKLSNDSTSVTTKQRTSPTDDSDSDDDDDTCWENVPSKPNEEMVIQKVIFRRNCSQRIALL